MKNFKYNFSHTRDPIKELEKGYYYGGWELSANRDIIRKNNTKKWLKPLPVNSFIHTLPGSKLCRAVYDVYFTLSSTPEIPDVFKRISTKSSNRQ